jgi:hypothetical protein
METFDPKIHKVSRAAAVIDDYGPFITGLGLIPRGRSTVEQKEGRAAYEMTGRIMAGLREVFSVAYPQTGGRKVAAKRKMAARELLAKMAELLGVTDV